MTASRTLRCVGTIGLVLMLVSCASGRSGQRGGPGLGPNALFARATELQADDKCAEAAPIYFRLAMRGTGFEDSQHRLGQCLMEEAHETGSLTSFLGALVWFRRSAETGWAEAQGSLIVAYLEGPPAVRDPVEAAMWLALYVRNPGRNTLGFRPLAGDTLERLKSTLTPDQLAEGETRARSWKTVQWHPPRAAPGGDGQRSRSGREEPRADRDGGPGGGRDRGRKRPPQVSEINY